MRGDRARGGDGWRERVELKRDRGERESSKRSPREERES